MRRKRVTPVRSGSSACSCEFEGTVERDVLEWAIRRVVREAEPARAAFFEVDGQVFQRAIDYPDVKLAFHDLSDSRDPVQEARR